MFLTKNEILDTPNALKKTEEYFSCKWEEIKAFFNENRQKRFAFFGCGSSHMLAKSGAALFQTFPQTCGIAVPAGDYIVEPEFWGEAMKETIIVCLSRSGKTSEMVMAMKHIKENYGSPVISISMKDDNDIMPYSDLDLTLDWCYDMSVCQTRTVTNLYAATLLLGAAYSGCEKLYSAVRAACADNKSFMARNYETLEKLAKEDWNNAVVLADGPLCGIAEEASLAFTEISMLTGRYFHLLDFRHGPIVISTEKTLTIAVLRSADNKLENEMVRDVIAKGGTVVTISENSENTYGSAYHIQVPNYGSFAAAGISIIYVAQMAAYLKAIELGNNPDAPTGLDAYITL